MKDVFSNSDFGKTDASSIPSKQRIFIVDDHTMFRKAVINWLTSEHQLEVVGEANSFQSALTQLRQVTADLVIVDISLSGINGLELIKHLRSEMPALKILVLSMYDEDRYAPRTLKAGAHGFLMKRESGEELLEAVRKVLAGETYLSPAFRQKLAFRAAQGSKEAENDPLNKLTDRELEILRLVGMGQSTRQISETLRISVKTVETHRLHLKEKLDLKNAADLVRFAIDWTELQQI